MKIMIISSMSFAKNIIDIKNKLERIGHSVLIPTDTYECIEKPHLNLNMDLNFCINSGLLSKGFNKIKESDAILVLNNKKENIDGYIGGAVLMEIGLAFYLEKKIFILNKLPNESDLRYVCEIKQTKPVILNGKLDKI